MAEFPKPIIESTETLSDGEDYIVYDYEERQLESQGCSEEEYVLIKNNPESDSDSDLQSYHCTIPNNIPQNNDGTYDDNSSSGGESAGKESTSPDDKVPIHHIRYHHGTVEMRDTYTIPEDYLSLIFHRRLPRHQVSVEETEERIENDVDPSGTTPLTNEDSHPGRGDQSDDDTYLVPTKSIRRFNDSSSAGESDEDEFRNTSPHDREPEKIQGVLPYHGSGGALGGLTEEYLRTISHRRLQHRIADEDREEIIRNDVYAGAVTPLSDDEFSSNGCVMNETTQESSDEEADSFLSPDLGSDHQLEDGTLFFAPNEQTEHFNDGSSDRKNSNEEIHRISSDDHETEEIQHRTEEMRDYNLFSEENESCYNNFQHRISLEETEGHFQSEVSPNATTSFSDDVPSSSGDCVNETAQQNSKEDDESDDEADDTYLDPIKPTEGFNEKFTSDIKSALRYILEENKEIMEALRGRDSISSEYPQSIEKQYKGNGFFTSPLLPLTVPAACNEDCNSSSEDSVSVTSESVSSSDESISSSDSCDEDAPPADNYKEDIPPKYLQSSHVITQEIRGNMLNYYINEQLDDHKCIFCMPDNDRIPKIPNRLHNVRLMPCQGRRFLKRLVAQVPLEEVYTLRAYENYNRAKESDTFSNYCILAFKNLVNLELARLPGQRTNERLFTLLEIAIKLRVQDDREMLDRVMAVNDFNDLFRDILFEAHDLHKLFNERHAEVLSIWYRRLDSITENGKVEKDPQEEPQKKRISNKCQPVRGKGSFQKKMYNVKNRYNNIQQPKRQIKNNRTR